MYIYAQTQKKNCIHTHTESPNSAFYSVFHKTAFKSLLGYTIVKLKLKLTFQSINKYLGLQMNKIQSIAYEKLLDEAKQRTLSLLLLIETRVQMFSPWLLICNVTVQVMGDHLFPFTLWHSTCPPWIFLSFLLIWWQKRNERNTYLDKRQSSLNE